VIATKASKRSSLDCDSHSRLKDISPTEFSMCQNLTFTSSAGAVGALFAGAPWMPALGATPVLSVASRTLEVNKKAATVFSVLGSNGKPGIKAQDGDRFSGDLLNSSNEPLQMHWHGQVKAPAIQDRARPDGGALAVGQTDAHDFALTPGTHWMHSHSLSEQQL
jgi:FtsP/CotA-like multicopper oxidase with cupredoxin domain